MHTKHFTTISSVNRTQCKIWDLMPLQSPPLYQKECIASWQNVYFLTWTNLSRSIISNNYKQAKPDDSDLEGQINPLVNSGKPRFSAFHQSNSLYSNLEYKPQWFCSNFILFTSLRNLFKAVMVIMLGFLSLSPPRLFQYILHLWIGN